MVCISNVTQNANLLKALSPATGIIAGGIVGGSDSLGRALFWSRTPLLMSVVSWMP